MAGLREMKKRRTRDQLVAAALTLIRAQGFDKTTAAQIAEAAELSPRTFFLHFATKEDVLLANAAERTAVGVDAIAARPPGATVDETLLDAVRRMIDHNDSTDVADGLAALRAELIATVPAVRARVAEHALTAQDELADALRAGYGDDLDPIEAAARVGAVVGAVNAAMLAALRLGRSPADQRDAMLRAAEFAIGSEGATSQAR
ncbi:TetR family transcriptional regulator [Phytomonospora sp. NPDC050363]|uniref:TetR/AcrR family transcriptional regulator n=1 Tax=Phytomonospora sp. NPDC050363 TaxID=3155642 RepID=UPI0033DF7491